MVSQVTSVAFSGIETTPVQVQVHIANGLPAFTIVGLPDKAIAESRETCAPAAEWFPTRTSLLWAHRGGLL